MNQRGFVQKLFGDCLDTGSRIVERPSVPVHGSFDPATNSGAITGSAYAFRVDNFNAHSRAIIIGSLGLKAVGGGAVVTGRIQRTRTMYARLGPRKPLLRIRRMTYGAGVFRRQGKAVPDTFVIGGSGHATVLPAFARELTRIRCRGPHIVTSHPIRAGLAFGVVQLQLRPDAATGLGGTFEIGGLEVSGYDATTEEDVTVAVTPTAPARQAGQAIRWDLPADLRTPLQCEASYSCVPKPGAQIPLGGGFVLSRGDRSAVFANLAVSFEELAGSPTAVVTGTLDGTPITVMHGSSTTTEFDDRVGAALGITDLRSVAAGVAAHFSRTTAP